MRLTPLQYEALCYALGPAVVPCAGCDLPATALLPLANTAKDLLDAALCCWWRPIEIKGWSGADVSHLKALYLAAAQLSDHARERAAALEAKSGERTVTP